MRTVHGFNFSTYSCRPTLHDRHKCGERNRWAIARSSPNGCACNRRPPTPNIVRVLPYRLHATLSSHPQLTSSMASTSQRSKGPDVVLSRLDIAIQFLSAAKDVCSVAPAQIALGSACTLLTMIRVRSLLFLGGDLPIHVYSGYHQQQTGFHRSRTVLRPCLRSPRTGVEGEQIRSTQRPHAQGHRATHNVSQIRTLSHPLTKGDRRTIEEIQKRVEKKSKQHRVSGFLHAKSDKEAIAGWRQEFDDVLKVFSVRSVGHV